MSYTISRLFGLSLSIGGARYILMLWIILSLCLLAPSVTFAQAFRLQSQSAAAAGQGNAFSAQADDASAIHYNPSGLSQVHGVQLLTGTTLLGGSIKYKSPTGIDTRGDFGGSVAFPPPSYTYLSANLGSLGWESLSKVTVGLGLTTPYGLNTRYPVNGPFNSAATFATLPLIDIKPTLAYKVNDQLAFGLSADIYTFASFLGEGQVEQRSISPGGAIPAGSAIELNGKGTGAGFTASMLYTPFRNAEGKPLASVGLVYTSQAALPLNGSLLANGGKVADSSTTLVLPPIYRGALAVWPVRTGQTEWKVEFDVEYVGWKSNRNLDVQLSNGTMIPQPQQWKNVPVVAVGTEYKWINPGWFPHWDVAVRSGYTRTENPTPDSTFNPAIIALSSHTISLGAGFLCKGQGQFLGLVPCGGESPLWPKAIGFDLAFQEWLYEPRTVAGNLNPAVNGNYHVYIHLGTASLKFVF